MKTLELKLKKDVLIIDAENGFNHFKIYDDEIGFIFIENGIPRKELVKGSYKFLCKGSELTEEIASELVEKGKNSYGEIKYENHYNEIGSFIGYDDALPSIISAVESKEKFWLENPIEKPLGTSLNDSFFKMQLDYHLENEWQEAEEKTFKNPLIFVKK